jgi:hypothetical protein
MKFIMKNRNYGNGLLCKYEKAMDGKIKPEEKTKIKKFELNEQKKFSGIPEGIPHGSRVAAPPIRLTGFCPRNIHSSSVGAG